VEAALRHLLAEGMLHVLLDGGMLRFCDVGAMRMLALVHEELHGRGGELVIVVPPAVYRLSQFMWPGAPSGNRPAVFQAGEGAATTVPLTARQHIPILRSLRPESRLRTRLRRESLPAAGLVSELHPLLERSARLRMETAAQRERMLVQAREACAILAETHDRLACLHATLEAGAAVRGALRVTLEAGSAVGTVPHAALEAVVIVGRPPPVPVETRADAGAAASLTCDGQFHRTVADSMRDRVATFGGYLR
jgi:hypothetical protein